MLDLCLESLNENGRVVLCGAISSSEDTSKFEGPSNYINLILKSAKMEGFKLEKFKDKFKEASHTLVRWIQQKELDSLEENVMECTLDNKQEVSKVLESLFSDDYGGKLILRLKKNTQ